MTDARDQINLAAWMERRMDAIGPYGPHILDGVKRYEARISHHDDVVRELVEALEFYAVLANWKRNGPLDASSSFFTGGPASAALANIAQDA